MKNKFRRDLFFVLVRFFTETEPAKRGRMDDEVILDFLYFYVRLLIV